MGFNWAGEGRSSLVRGSSKIEVKVGPDAGGGFIQAWSDSKGNTLWSIVA